MRTMSDAHLSRWAVMFSSYTRGHNALRVSGTGVCGADREGGASYLGDAAVDHRARRAVGAHRAVVVGGWGLGTAAAEDPGEEPSIVRVERRHRLAVVVRLAAVVRGDAPPRPVGQRVDGLGGVVAAARRRVVRALRRPRRVPQDLVRRLGCCGCGGVGVEQARQQSRQAPSKAPLPHRGAGGRAGGRRGGWARSRGFSWRSLGRGRGGGVGDGRAGRFWSRGAHENPAKNAKKPKKFKVIFAIFGQFSPAALDLVGASPHTPALLMS